MISSESLIARGDGLALVGDALAGLLHGLGLGDSFGHAADAVGLGQVLRGGPSCAARR